MKREKVEYKEGKELLEGYMACQKEEKRPLVLVFHAWKGRDEFAMKAAEKMAHLGYLGFAVDIYGKGILGRSVEENAKLMDPFMRDRILLQKRLLAGLKTGLSLPQADQNQIAAIGFCFGGLCALDLARSGADVKGVVSFHGLLQSPMDIRSDIKAKILALHGHDDPMVPPNEVAAFTEEMTNAGADWQIHIYGNTKHAFSNPNANDPKLGTVYNPVAEKRAFQSMELFMKEIFSERP